MFSKLFRAEEFDDPEMMSGDLMAKLHEFRRRVDRPITITSSTRGNHAENSQHYLGTAVDIIIPNSRLFDMYLLAERCLFNGIGLYPHWEMGEHQGGMHIDVRNGLSARWMGIKRINGSQEYVALDQFNLEKYDVI